MMRLCNIDYYRAIDHERYKKALEAGSRIIEARFCEFTACSHEDLALEVFQAMYKEANLVTFDLPSPKSP